MSNPLERAAARPVPVEGGVCTLRYRVEELAPDTGADFSAATQLLDLSRGRVDAGAAPAMDEACAVARDEPDEKVETNA